MRSIPMLFGSGLLLIATTLGAHAEKRVALVIGNGAYANAAELPNPRNDAEDVASALRRMGFATIAGFDLDKEGMDEATINFARAAREADVALFYYSGHAIQFSDINYLMPVDAKLTDEADLRRMARVDEIMADLQQAKNLRILVLDACRDNPLAEELKRSIGRTRAAGMARGLAKIDSPEGMIVAFSTQAQRTADDGTGRNSPYTAAFLKHIEEQGEIGRIFRRISADVYKTTGKKQLPELSLSLIGEYYLRGEPVAPSAGPTQPPPVSSTPDPARHAWDAARDTDSVDVLKAFIDKFGDSFYASLAKARLAKLKKKGEEKKVAVVAPPTPVTPPKSGETFKDCNDCPEMVVVPAGKFIMGSAPGEDYHLKNESPQHTVAIVQPFAVGKFEVTRDQFETFVKDSDYDAGSKCRTNENKEARERSGRSFRNPGIAQGGNEPALCINWHDAKAYVAWLSKKTGRSYRLLSEAEWEYAARARSQTRFSFGNDDTGLCGHGNAVDRTAKTIFKHLRVQHTTDCTDNYLYTSPVGAFAANGFGLHDMHGNVFEWVEDCYHESYAGAPADGSAWTSGGDCSRRIVRGGSWADYPFALRSAYRFGQSLRLREYKVGFRVASTL